MRTLIIKLGAAGDVVRTSTLLRRLTGHITWLTSRENRGLLDGIEGITELLDRDQRERLRGRCFDHVINLEDTDAAVEIVETVHFERLSGACRPGGESLGYSDDLAEWFDMSLISRFGKEQADRLKLQNRRSYQEILFAGLGLGFQGETYVLPAAERTDLEGDVAIAPRAGSVWPSKNWAYFDELARALRGRSLRVNFLPQRRSLAEHLGDVQNHRCLVSGDSLPMHLALGSGVPCVTLFTCTSPWEIYGYGLQTKIVSPLLEQFFYCREFDRRAVTAIRVREVFEAVLSVLEDAVKAREKSAKIS